LAGKESLVVAHISMVAFGWQGVLSCCTYKHG
jgi:hypothetical protein